MLSYYTDVDIDVSLSSDVGDDVDMCIQRLVSLTTAESGIAC